MVYVGCYLWWALGWTIVDWIISGIRETERVLWSEGAFTSGIVEPFRELYVNAGLVGAVLGGIILIGCIIAIVVCFLSAIYEKKWIPSLIVGVVSGIVFGVVNSGTVEIVLTIAFALFLAIFVVFDDSIDVAYSSKFGWIWWFKK